MIALGGCANDPPAGQSITQSPVYATPATDLFKRVQTVLAAPPISLQSSDLGNGQLLTDWQEGLRGDFHIVRYWHERTHNYHITASAARTSPIRVIAAGCRSAMNTGSGAPDEGGINVAAKTWSDAPNIKRPERSDALLKQIETQLTTFPCRSLARPEPGAPGSSGNGRRRSNEASKGTRSFI